MTHVFGLAATLGSPGGEGLAAHGVAAPAGPFRDAGHGGWSASLGPARSGVDSTEATHVHEGPVPASAARRGVRDPELPTTSADPVRVVREPGSERSLRREPSPSRHRRVTGSWALSDAPVERRHRTRRADLPCELRVCRFMTADGHRCGVSCSCTIAPREVGSWTYHPWRRSLCRFRHRPSTQGAQRCRGLSEPVPHSP